MNFKTLVIGARGSKLSLIQAIIVKDLLQVLLPQTLIEIRNIKTSGDKNMNPIPLDTIGKGWFTKEIDKQLLDGKIDLAVHSLKDLLDMLMPGLVIAAVPQRENASEALISRNNLPFHKLKHGAVIGTDSIRRKMQLLKMRPDLQVKSVRGNLHTRLDKLDRGEYDALILAVAGLNRLGLQNRITQYFETNDFIPSPGQGALAVVTRANNKKLNALLAQLNHIPTLKAVAAERAFSVATDGGCSMPVGAYAEINKRTLTLYGMLGSVDEKYMVKGSIRGNIKDPEELGKKLADKLIRQSASWYSGVKPNYVVLTRETKANDPLAKRLETIGIKTIICPSISVSKNLSKNQFRKYVANISMYQWIIFTSSNGIRFFVRGLSEIGNDVSFLKNIHIAAVGEKTAEIAKKFGLSVSLIPTVYTAKHLVKTLVNIEGKHILLPRSTIGNKDIKKQLEKKGAIVTDMPLYKTTFPKVHTQELEKLLQTNHILYLTFTSPSTVEGFLSSVSQSSKRSVLSLPVLSIGPVTTSAAKKHGFTKVQTADIHTIDGMFRKMKESIL